MMYGKKHKLSSPSPKALAEEEFGYHGSSEILLAFASLNAGSLPLLKALSILSKVSCL